MDNQGRVQKATESGLKPREYVETKEVSQTVLVLLGQLDPDFNAPCSIPRLVKPANSDFLGPSAERSLFSVEMSAKHHRG